MKLRKCFSCGEYTLEEKCGKCPDATGEAGYKFVKIRDVAERKSK